MGNAGGASPIAGLTFAHGVHFSSGGALFGGAGAGTNSAGLLFGVNIDGSGYTILHEFTGLDGYGFTGLLQHSANGSFFGVTQYGGPGYTGASFGHGVIFSVREDGTYTLLHSFPGGAGGNLPSDLLIDASGNLFGSAVEGGSCDVSSGCGVVFKFVPSTGAYTVIHTFNDATDGRGPMLGAIGPDGTLYGATMLGGQNNHGTLFSLTPNASGYTMSVLAALKSHVPGDGPTSAPTLSPGGTLVGGTFSYLYYYRNGKLGTPDPIREQFADCSIQQAAHWSRWCVLRHVPFWRRNPLHFQQRACQPKRMRDGVRL